MFTYRRGFSVIMLLGVILLAAALPRVGAQEGDGQDEIALEQEVSLDFLDESATISLPEGWVVRPLEEGLYMFGKDERSIELINQGIDQVFENIITELEGGSTTPQATPTPIAIEEVVVGMVAVGNKADLGMSGMSIESFVVENFDYQGSPFPVDMIEEIEVNGHPAILIPMQFTGENMPDGMPETIVPSGVVVVADFDTFFLNFMGIALAETDQTALFEAIVGTIDVDAVASRLPDVAYDHHLFDMLALVPASVARLESAPQVSYMDYRAVEQAWDDAPAPQSWEEWQALRDSDSEGWLLWIANSFRIQSGPPAQQSLMMLENMSTIMGFDFFDIDQLLMFGQPPETGFVYGGDFDAEAIAEAHTARQYTSTDVGEAVLWCGPVGCEEGLTMDMAESEPANIFGGDFGRQFPFALVAEHVVTAGPLPVVEGMLAAYHQETLSLLDVPAYRAVAEALTQENRLLVQAQFFRAQDVGFIPQFGTAPNEELMQDVLEGYGTLPPYELAVLADLQQGDEQVAVMALVYSSEDAARTAAQELTARVASFPRLDAGVMDPMLESDNINGRMDDPATYYSEAADKWIAMATALYPVPGRAVEASDDSSSHPPMGGLFRLWVSNLYRLTLTPLVVGMGS